MYRFSNADDDADVLSSAACFERLLNLWDKRNESFMVAGWISVVLVGIVGVYTMEIG